MEYTREEIKLSLDFICNLNSFHIVGQQYLDITFFNEIMAQAFWEPRVLLYPQGRVHPYIGKYKADVQSTNVYIYLMEKDIGYQCVGVEVGPHSTFLNQVFKQICARAAK
jgi:hypothetical protein